MKVNGNLMRAHLIEVSKNLHLDSADPESVFLTSFLCYLH